MKTFFNLVQEVQKPGLCYRCGGCATFCTAINYGALEIDKSGKPVYQDMEKCIECGLCYSICPEINDLDEETKRQAAWSDPMGRVIETTVVRSSDVKVRDRATDGGAVTGILLHLFDRNRIDGAIVTRPVGKFQRQPFLATTREEILESAGLFFDTSQGMKQFSDQYMTFSTIEEFDPMIKKGLKRVALVGTPCQIKSLRKMQVLNLIPSDSIKFCFGLFCSGNFTFGIKEQQYLADIAGISWDDVVKINLKDKFIITLDTGDVKTVELGQMDSMKRYACHYCSDYSAEFADISFGGIGAEVGWTTVITRTPLGRAVLADSRHSKSIEQFDVEDNPEFASSALQEVRKASSAKKKNTRYKRRGLQAKSVQVKV
ncbi:MAG: Coenzyme F420 hydrogenase/dehydrogenase, beta subunit C-terminal domain [Proteobacteria bacterium]|nr:Coenzyme F420 hydrogenase/dehydrogenase, beta subunit C-terminal domain [Pseudomonadota bacterium]MBU1583258.1 Coenzyme F420 hydrogenase/dehydrogenase, beta subunit C-terminal domain [Pseudomonadota bacterium]MBU2455349.1 Coenzyme F420 hydrogenase/dehydrogenase, beta subunit C-terminal domain [Pseudomonadota bacterium]MBU2629346.1 Coenzyme F420 hydrogenase/dehydrogenase, beta subunit C-terminal domain [Pseudomonadota bacterium]